MNSASTEDCKKFIQTNAASLGLPADGVWKRKSKSKQDDGWLRVFEHATGATVHLIEPFGQGASGLRAELPAQPLKTESASFASASPAMKAAMLWRDAMRALGGSLPLHTVGPQAHGWSWKDFVDASKDHSGNDNRDNVQELTQEWVDEGMVEPASRALLLDGVSWCFDTDSEYCEAEGYWSASEGVRVVVFPTDAPSEMSSDLANPIYSTDLENSSENIFNAGCDAATGREAFIRAWHDMAKLGCHFDMAMQKECNENGDYDEAAPIDKKIRKIIPELIAQEEATKIARKIAKKASISPQDTARAPSSRL